MTIEEIAKDIEPLIREKVRMFVIRKLSVWDHRTDLPKLIDEETENFMKTIRTALRRTKDD